MKAFIQLHVASLYNESRFCRPAETPCWPYSASAGEQAGLRALYCEAQQGSWAKGCLTFTFILGMCRIRRIHCVNK